MRRQPLDLSKGGCVEALLPQVTPERPDHILPQQVLSFDICSCFFAGLKLELGGFCGNTFKDYICLCRGGSRSHCRRRELLSSADLVGVVSEVWFERSVVDRTLLNGEPAYSGKLLIGQNC